MFYRPGTPHGLRHNPFNALIIPRPVGWISSIAADGTPNLAPYSFFNAIAYEPPQVMIAVNGRHGQGGLKDTRANIEATGEFVVNLCTWDLREAMNASAAHVGREVDEFVLAGVTAEAARIVRAPQVKESPIHLECRHLQTVALKSWDADAPNSLVIGEVVGIHISDDVIVEGMIDYGRLNAIGRLGYMDYLRIGDVFSMTRPR